MLYKDIVHYEIIVTYCKWMAVVSWVGEVTIVCGYGTNSLEISVATNFQYKVTQFQFVF